MSYDLRVELRYQRELRVGSGTEQLDEPGFVGSIERRLLHGEHSGEVRRFFASDSRTERRHAPLHRLDALVLLREYDLE